jgi:hypothetical protein
MANRFTNKEYQMVKNQNYVLVAFRNGKRVMTYAGLSMYKLIKEMQMHQRIGDRCLFFTEEEAKGDLMIEWDYEYYHKKYIQKQTKEE